MDKSIVLFQTESNNCYFHSSNINQILLMHPIQSYLLKKKLEGINLQEWIDKLQRETEIENIGIFSKDEIIYYYNKIMLLQNNGYFENINIKESINARLDAEQIKFNLAKSGELTFEVTELCNLQCEYCSYGKFYQNYDKRNNKNLSFKTAVNLINFLINFINSSYNKSYDKKISIGFYGGEPLLNFKFIKDIVNYIKDSKVYSGRLEFRMTTNALLLNKHIDFLVENKFNVLISLDGNEDNNAYRVFPDGSPAFKTILANVNEVRMKYPKYFNEHVKFNAVLHNKNSVSEIINFFNDNYDTVPLISELSSDGIQQKEKENFLKMLKNFNESLNQAEDYSLIERKMFVETPNISHLADAIHYFSGYVFKNYNDLKFVSKRKHFLPTGTCSPFSKGLFVTVNGKILPCERIGHQYELGYVDDQNINIDFNKIADKYNLYYDKIRKYCNNCHIVNNCLQCIFNLEIETNDPQCNGFMNYKDFSKHLSSRISYLEKNPELYLKIMKEVTNE